MTRGSWTLKETVAALTEYRLVSEPSVDIVLRNIVTDSRDASDESLFFALPGTKADGATFVSDAAQRGAKAIVTLREVPDIGVPQIVVPDVRNALARIAKQWYGAPDDDLLMIGVTGTNGKTTTVGMIRTVAESGGYVAGSIGTLGVMLGSESIPQTASRPTTPEAHELRQMLNTLRDRGAKLVAMETTSHALSLDRVWGMRFDVAVYTNLTRDHLDFHGTFDDYFAAKSRLFRELGGSATAVINIDDEYGKQLIAMTNARVLTYGMSPNADIHPIEMRDTPRIDGCVRTPIGDVTTSMALVGGFNVENMLATVGACVAIGMTPDRISDGLRLVKPLPGRFEPVSIGQDFTVIVDYAHTPDALENVLSEARRMTNGRVLCAVGCGGDRDRAKRPIMGEIATRLADYTVFTSDNPRTEDPESIIDEIVAGANGGHPFERIESRRAALRRVIGMAHPGDVVMIPGKGHEPYQEICGVKHPYDDRIEARKALEERYGTQQIESGDMR